MCGTHAPRFPSLPAVLSFWFAFGFGPGFGHSLSCGCWGQGPLSALHLDFDFAWARGGSSSLSIVGYTLSVRSVPRYQLRPLSVLARIWSPELTRAVRCGARLQLREGSVNPPVKQNVNHAGVKSSIDSLMMFNEPTPRYPVVLLAPGVVPALPADGFLSLHLPDRFICLPPGCLPAWMPVTALWVDGFICLPAWISGTALRADGFICLPLSPSCCPPAWMPGTAPWSFAVYSAGTHVCLRLRNVCLSARVRLIKPQAACCGCTYECFK